MFKALKKNKDKEKELKEKELKEKEWKKIQEELGIVSQIEVFENHNIKSNEEFYYVDLEKFMKKYKGIYELDIVFSETVPKHEVVLKIFNWDDFKLTKASSVFLENSDRGVSFIGIGDLEKKLLHVHPLIPDNGRTTPAADESELSFYKGIYDSSAFVDKPIMHNSSKEKAKGLRWGIDFVSLAVGTQAHSTLLKYIANLEMSDGKTYFGFSVLDTGKDEKGNPIKIKSGKKKASFRLRSNSLNNQVPKKWTVHNLKDYPGKKYIKLGMHKIYNYDSLEMMLNANTPKTALLPQNASKRLAKAISNQITHNKRLKESLVDFENTDVF